MLKKCIGAIALVALLAATSAAQDAKAIISNASKAMGVDGLNSVTFYGAGANFNLGQNNNSNAPWPRANANDYVRTIDFMRPASRATWVTYGAMSPLPAMVNVPPDLVKPPAGVLGQKCPGEGVQMNAMPVGKPIWPPRHALPGRSPRRLAWSKAAVAWVA